MWYLVVIVDDWNSLEAVVPVYAVNSDKAKEKALAQLTSTPGLLVVEAVFACGREEPELL